MSAGEVPEHRVRVVALCAESEQRPQARVVEDVPPRDGLSGVRRLASTPAVSLAWAASMPLAGGGLAWYAVQRCYVC